MSRSGKKQPRRKTVPNVKNNKPLRSASSPAQLSAPQISVIAALLSGFFDVESVLYNRNNELKVILTSTVLTHLPILGNPGFGLTEEDVALDIIESNNQT